MPLTADRRDYKRAFIKHSHAINNWGKIGSDISRNLVLAYCVECGLKYMVMEEKRAFRVDDLAETEVKNMLHSHNIKELLKETKMSGSYSFQAFKTKHNDSVTLESFHQLCRYGIEPMCQMIVDQYNRQLLCIMKDLEGKI